MVVSSESCVSSDAVVLTVDNFGDFVERIEAIGGKAFTRRVEIDDACQHYMLVLLRKIKNLGSLTYENYEHFRKSTRIAIRRHYFNEQKAKTARLIQHDKQAVDAYETAEMAAPMADPFEFLDSLMWKLNPQEREFLELLMEGYKPEEIIEIKSVSRATYFRIMAGIREVIAE